MTHVQVLSKNLMYYMNADHKMIISLRGGATTNNISLTFDDGCNVSHSRILLILCYSPMRCTTLSEELEPPTLGGWKLMRGTL